MDCQRTESQGEGWAGPPWRRGPHSRRWSGRGRWKHGGRFLFLRFLMVFGFVLLFIFGGMAALAFLVTRLFGGDGQTAVIVWVGGIGLAMTFPILAVAMAIRAFRGIAMPLADVMAAADAVAVGDFSTRVREHGHGEFGRLARSFNRMTEELERTDQMRRNLTADVAHELRTPLHIIQGNLEGILDGVYEASEEHINATIDETRLLARLVDDLRTLSLAESGQLPLERKPIDVRELLEDVATSFSGQAEAAEVSLGVEIEDDASGLSVTGDAGRLDQVLSNLVVNAIRHTPVSGRIVLKAEAVADGVRVIVSDTGEGISPDDLPFIFDRFWRGDRSRSHVGGVGGGLGLAIARQLVSAHDGEIAVESVVGQGTTFTIMLPSSGVYV